jgi:prevent-host-death family protein
MTATYGLAGRGRALVDEGPELYIWCMGAPFDRSISEARRDLAAVVNTARTTQEPVYLSRRGWRVAAIVSSELLDRLQDLAANTEDILDAEAARQEMRESGTEPVRWAQAKADLGLA